MYSILEKHGSQVAFLAEADEDIITIIDACGPGSTIEVLADSSEAIHTFIKSPSGRWVIYKGESAFEMPVNDAGVSVFPPKMEAPASLTGDSIDTYQQGIQIYPTGYVTGTLHNAKMISNTTKDHPEKQVGHFIIFALDINDPANTYDLYDGDEQIQTGLKPLTANDYLLVRYESLQHPEKVQVKYKNGESFVFNLTGLELE